MQESSNISVDAVHSSDRFVHEILDKFQDIVEVFPKAPDVYDWAFVDNENIFSNSDTFEFDSKSSLSTSNSTTDDTPSVCLSFSNESSVVPEVSSKPLTWIDQSTDFSSEMKSGNGPGENLKDVEDVRKRLKKRTRREFISNTDQINENKSKRLKNTLAARRYRERQRKEVEILDSGIKKLELELSNTKMELMWWKMEAEKWRELAQRSDEKN